MIACILLVDFVSAVEGHHAPTLYLNSTGNVQAASFEAVQQGVHAGMRLQQAKALCTEAAAVAFNPMPYAQAIRNLTERLSTFTNRIEVAPGFWEEHGKKRGRKNIHPSAALLYLDLGRLRDKDELTVLARQTNLTVCDTLGTAAHIGLASSKFTASVAARFAHSQHPKIIHNGYEAAFLAALPITLLPLDAEAHRRLRLVGITTLGQLAELSSGALMAQFGTAGRLMYQLAHGQDDRPVSLLQPQPVEHLTLHLHGSVEDRLMLETILQSIGCDLQERLDKRSYTLRSLELTLHLDDGSFQHTSIALRKATREGGQIGRSLIRLLSKLTLLQSVVMVEVHAGDLQPVVWRQLDLFGQEFASQDQLKQLLDSLMVRFGSNSFYQINLTDPDHRLPERRFEITSVEVA